MGKGRNKLFGALAGLLLVQAIWLQGLLWPTWSDKYSPKGSTVATPGLDPGTFLVALAGFREMVAGILWVRADSFFDSGNYDAVLPLIRIVTILDPHQIDVYATGMWHIGYNFTDEEQRSDRRYLPSALQLGKEGSGQNPDTYELYFETGWLWMHKVDDLYPRAVDWMQQASVKGDPKFPETVEPPARKNMLARALERDGQMEKMIDLYYDLYQKAVEVYAQDKGFSNHQEMDVLEGNLDTLLVRMVQRGYMARKQGIYDSGNYDTKPPFDVGFSAKVSVIDAKVLRIEGTWNVLPLGTRIKVVLRDSNFPNTIPGGVVWDAWKEVQLDPFKHLTYMQDQLYVKNQRFNRKVDMSKDPTMYPLESKDYIVEFYYNPRSAPPHIQDKFGWNGEGMTDKSFIASNLDQREGVRCFYTTLHLTRQQVLRKGEWADKVPIVTTDNYKESGPTLSDQDIILTPSLRGSEPVPK